MVERSKAAKSIAWSAIERVASQGCQLILSIIIARLVMPSDYGKIALVTVLLNIAQALVDCGFTNALIQKKDKTDVDYTTVFWTNLGIGVVVYLLLFLCAPFIASFYNVEELRLVIRVLAACVVLDALCIVQRTRFVVKLDFRVQALISFSAVLVGGIAGIVLAYNGYGVWALVIQSILISLASMILYWLFSKWRPSFVFSKESFNSLFGFGSKLMIAGIINTLYQNMYTITIAKFYKASDLGLYNRAESLAKQPMYNVTIILARVIYPIECEWQDDNKELLNKYNYFLRLVSFVVFPAMFGLAALADPIIRIVLTDKWAGCVPILQILCFVAMFDPVIRLTWDILNVKHRSDYSLVNEILNKSVAVLALALTLSHGIIAVCIGVLAYSLLNVMIMTFFTRKVLPGLTFFNVLRQVLRPLVMSSAMFLAVRFSISFIHPNILKVFLGIAVGVFSYVFVAFIAKSDELKTIWSLLLSFMKGRREVNHSVEYTNQ